MCKFILKSIQNCRSDGPDKNLAFMCDLDLGPTYTNVSNDTSTCDGEQMYQVILKYIHKCRSYGPDKFGRTDGRTHALTHAHTRNCHCDNYVRLTASRLDKKRGILAKTEGRTGFTEDLLGSDHTNHVIQVSAYVSLRMLYLVSVSKEMKADFLYIYMNLTDTYKL